MKWKILMLISLSGVLASIDSDSVDQFVTTGLNDSADNVDNQNDDRLFETFVSAKKKPEQDFVIDLKDHATNDLHLDRFLEDFDRVDCQVYNGDPNDPNNSLCPEVLQHSSLSPLGEFNTDHESLYNYLDSNLFSPLASKVPKQENIADLLVASSRLADKNSIFYQQDIVANRQKFFNTIMQMFNDIAAKTSNLESNQDEINDNITSLIQRFHLY